MMTVVWALVFTLVSVLVAVGLLFWVRRLPFAVYLKETNDVAGFYITIIGTLYAVILAFMFFAVWGRFEVAEDYVSQEASALVDMHKLAEGLSEPYRAQVQEACSAYAREVIQKEWPAMETKQASLDTLEGDTPLFKLLTTYNPPENHDQLLLSQILGRHLELVKDRRMRLHKAGADIPNLLWAMLFLGGLITVGFSCLFGVDKFWLHLLKCATLSATIGLVLFVIWAIDDPFQGDVSVRPVEFERALKEFDQKR